MLLFLVLYLYSMIAWYLCSSTGGWTSLNPVANFNLLWPHLWWIIICSTLWSWYLLQHHELAIFRRSFWKYWIMILVLPLWAMTEVALGRLKGPDQLQATMNTFYHKSWWENCQKWWVVEQPWQLMCTVTVHAYVERFFKLPIHVLLMAHCVGAGVALEGWKLKAEHLCTPWSECILLSCSFCSLTEEYVCTAQLGSPPSV